jgi:hypothetical protein
MENFTQIPNDVDVIMEDVYDSFEESQHESQESDSQEDDFEADPDEDAEEERATQAWTQRQRDNVPDPVLPTAPQIAKPRAFFVADPHIGGAQQLVRSDAFSAMSDDESIDPENDPKQLAIVDPKLRNRKHATTSLGQAQAALRAQEDLIVDLSLQIDDARHKRTSLQAKLNYARKHHKSTTSKLRAQQTHSLKVVDLKIKNRDKKIKYGHIDGVCDGLKFNNQKCSKLSKGSIFRQAKRLDYCAEHEVKIRFPDTAI